MKKHYLSPEVVDYGDVARITGILGPSGADDVFVDQNGNDISDQPGGDPGLPGGSLDACPTQDPVPGGQCEVNP